MINQSTYEELCRTYLSPYVQSIVHKYYSNSDSLMDAAQKKFVLHDRVIPLSALAELYAFSDYLKDYHIEASEEELSESGPDFTTTPGTLGAIAEENVEDIIEGDEGESPSLQEIRWWKKFDKAKADFLKRRKKRPESKLEDIKKWLINILKNADGPLTFEELFSKYKEIVLGTFPNESIIRQCIRQTKEIKIIKNKKYLYYLDNGKQNKVFSGSLYKAINNVLHSKSMPFLIDDLVAKVLELRPDSNQKSIKSIISSMLKSHRVFLYNDKYIGLDTIKYDKSFKRTEYETRLTFEEKLQRVKNFVAEHKRLPFTSGAREEVPLGLWLNRISHSTHLTTEQMVSLYAFKKEIDDLGMPQNAEQYSFQQNCIQYRAYVMRNGELVTYSQNERLYRWFAKYSIEHSSLQDIRKKYFDELISFLLNFGYELTISPRLNKTSKAGKRWTNNDLSKLEQMFKRGDDLADIAEQLRRPESAITDRLRKLGLIKWDKEKNEYIKVK